VPFNELHDQVRRLPFLDELVNPRNDRQGRQGAKYLSLAPEKAEPNLELLRVGTDHVFDGDGLAGTRVHSAIDRPEAAHGDQLLNTVTPFEHTAGCAGQKTIAPLAVTFPDRIRGTARGVGADYHRCAGFVGPCSFGGPATLQAHGRAGR
jgi:hypothetical protein